ncbi:MAG: RsmB/NOP family class I SAM-dependent RNA methyltransferase [Alphaproteobacteria bacterium]|nr:RsmB/NOP family class I SAM-dependent RNA methyltransferase [Alphaproteobacteria bacterium]
MKEAARIQTAIELTDEIFAFRQPADNTINVYFRTRRYIGSTDRRVVSDLVWQTLRHYGRLSSLSAEKLTGRAAVMMLLSYEKQDIETLFDGQKYAPAPLSEAEKSFLKQLPGVLPPPVLECPEWLRNKIDTADIVAMTGEAPLDLRVNTLKSDRKHVLALLEQAGIQAQETPYSSSGIRIRERLNVTSLPVFRDGLIEIQDEGSQIVSLLTRAEAGQTVIDWCAGAGGKTLAMSAMMRAKGTIYAVDNDPKRMRDLPDRACRAAANNVIVLNDYNNLKMYDLVLVDAPCTGSGTWRRSVDAKWRMTPEQSAGIIKTQREILDKACRFVKKGGKLFYITCSLDPAENENQVRAFLQSHNDFKLEDLSPVLENLTGQKRTDKTVRLNPSVFQTDGFFAASFIKK